LLLCPFPFTALHHLIFGGWTNNAAFMKNQSMRTWAELILNSVSVSDIFPFVSLLLVAAIHVAQN
jgi:hypothetical protein